MTGDVHKLGEVLRTAREGKGVDLARVERDTKIRERYLSALERGDYRDLPGAVYTKGFLRNYGAYLGLDPEYLIDLYRIESAAVAGERPRAPAAPRPLAARRSRAFVVTPGAVVAAILTVAVGGFVAYLGFEFVNFARTPELRITDPPGNVNGYTELEITIRGETEPNASVKVSNLPENPTVVADANGSFEVIVGLLPGSNVVQLVADDPTTGRESEMEQRTILVVTDAAASPSGAPTALSLDQPARDRTVRGPVPIAGTAAPGAEVEVKARLVRAPTATFAVTDDAGQPVSIQASPPPAPDPVTLTADAGGAFSGARAAPRRMAGERIDGRRRSGHAASECRSRRRAARDPAARRGVLSRGRRGRHSGGRRVWCDRSHRRSRGPQGEQRAPHPGRQRRRRAAHDQWHRHCRHGWRRTVVEWRITRTEG